MAGDRRHGARRSTWRRQSVFHLVPNGADDTDEDRQFRNDRRKSRAYGLYRRLRGSLDQRADAAPQRLSQPGHNPRPQHAESGRVGGCGQAGKQIPDRDLRYQRADFRGAGELRLVPRGEGRVFPRIYIGIAVLFAAVNWDATVLPSQFCRASPRGWGVRAVYALTATIPSISTEIWFGSMTLPTAERACCPASPNTSTNRSEQPLMTFGESLKFGTALTMPSSLTMKSTRSSEPSASRMAARSPSPTRRAHR